MHPDIWRCVETQMTKTSSSAGVTCPHCGFTHLDASIWALDEPKEIKCACCAEPFVCWTEHDVTYHARKIDHRLRQILREAIEHSPADGPLPQSPDTDPPQ
jgi:hypothetical protein